MTQKVNIPENVKVAIIDYLSGNWDECESTLLTSWIEENEENQEIFSQLVDLWSAESIIKNEKNFDVDVAWNHIFEKLDGKTSSGTVHANFREILKYVAVFIFALVIGGLGYSLIQKQNVFIATQVVEYTAPYGSQSDLKLQDGSVVKLNAGTTLKYDTGFGVKNRNIELNGEAYFEVAKNKELPFTVKAKDISVTALGTKFNVKAYDEEKLVSTVLMEGSVQVRNDELSQRKNIILEPNQKAVFNMNDHQFSLAEVDGFSEVSWFSEAWVIQNKSLKEFAKLLERRFDVSIQFNDNQINDFVFGGTFKGETIEQILTAISYSAPVKYKISNNQVTLSIEPNRLNDFNMLLK